MGAPVVVTVDPVLESGTRCYTCKVTWWSDAITVARWTGFGESGTFRSATLEPLQPGTVKLIVRICPGGRFRCKEQAIKRRVVR